MTSLAASSAELVQTLSPAVSWDLLGKLGLAVLLGGLVGFEREMLEKPAGLRTNILICLGAALFTHMSSYVRVWGSPSTPVDASRIASQIVSGIGFLGAGAIIQSRAHVRGLTTAATIWVVGAIGMAVGAGAFLAAVVGTALILMILVGLGVLERRIPLGWADVEIVVHLEDQDGSLKENMAALRDRGLRVVLLEVTRDRAGGPGQARLSSKAPRADLQELTEDLLRLPQVIRVHPS